MGPGAPPLALCCTHTQGSQRTAGPVHVFPLAPPFPQKLAHARAHERTRARAGADDFTPVLIYVTIKAAPDALASNVAFIERFRLASRLVSEAQYLFVQMVGS